MFCFIVTYSLYCSDPSEALRLERLAYIVSHLKEYSMSLKKRIFFIFRLKSLKFPKTLYREFLKLGTALNDVPCKLQLN